MKRLHGAIILPTIFFLSALATGQAGSGSLNDQLIAAASNGDTATVQQLLDKGANIEAKDSDGYTALERAESNDMTEAAALLRASCASWALP
jgi:ankyrin repeat protein